VTQQLVEQGGLAAAEKPRDQRNRESRSRLIGIEQSHVSPRYQRSATSTKNADQKYWRSLRALCLVPVFRAHYHDFRNE
jgi:hypothetical protein